MFLPNADKAIIKTEKISDYVLNLDHFEGKNKARVFASVLGLKKENTVELINAIREAILKNDAIKQFESEYGTKYTVDFQFSFNNKTATIRSGWLIEKNGDTARLITCYVKL